MGMMHPGGRGVGRAVGWIFAIVTRVTGRHKEKGEVTAGVKFLTPAPLAVAM